MLTNKQIERIEDSMTNTLRSIERHDRFNSDDPELIRWNLREYDESIHYLRGMKSAMELIGYYPVYTPYNPDTTEEAYYTLKKIS